MSVYEPVFIVQDNGIGIESRYLERIFSLFGKPDAMTEAPASVLRL